ncbi:MAG TPA: SpoIID/LytB domain-containing protein [Gemmatimonadales bacterium]|nr:SpoIID/LytB domain-containing protein [Gemmatimonadales bacterium]
MPISTSQSHNWTPRWARHGLASLLALAAAACPRPAAIAPGGEPELRVGISVGAPRVTLGGDGELFVTDDGNAEPLGSIPAGASWTVVADTPGLRLVKPDGTPSERHFGISAVNVTEGRFAMADGRRYRGRVNVIRDPTGLTLINRVPVESYVAGVIGGELGPRRPDERQAMLAQAVVSRSFALRNRGRWEAQGFDAWADVRDQVYAGVAGETPEVWEAVRQTRGEVLRYRGEIIEAYFHSTCGRSTAGVDEVFRTAATHPYLRPVSDAAGRGHYYDEISPHFRWREEWDGPQLRAILSRTLPAVMNTSGGGLQRITDLEVSRTTASGRVGELRIVFEHGAVQVPGADVRAVLRPQPDQLLASAAFQLQVTKDGGQVTRVVALGTGWGHGVGFCQWGAVGRARAGQDYRAIATTYFPGTSLEHLY